MHQKVGRRSGPRGVMDEIRSHELCARDDHAPES